MTTRISNVSQRAKQGDRKVVFKNSLENPYKTAWPVVPLNIQNMVLASLLALLEGVGEYNLKKQAINKKLKRSKHNKDRKEKARAKNTGLKVDREGNNPTMKDPIDHPMMENSSNQTEDITTITGTNAAMPLPTEPPILSHLTYGINEVTKRLEKQAKSRRHQEVVSVAGSSGSSEVSPPEAIETPLSHIFVCRSDIDPPLLVAHLPELVATCNVPIPSRPFTPVYLISLPKHAESSLAESLALKRVSILAFDVNTPRLDTVTKLLAAVSPPSAPWLTLRDSQPSKPPLQLLPTHIKQLRTTAPRDIRKAKEERKVGQQAAKEKKKEKNFKTKLKDTKMKRKLKIVSGSKNILPT